MKDQTEQLIEILLDKAAREDERDDTAIDLRAYNDIRVLDALTEIAADSHEDDVIVNNCAESIGEICVEMNFFDEQLFRKLIPFAQKIVFYFIMSKKPQLINPLLRNKLFQEFK